MKNQTVKEPAEVYGGLVGAASPLLAFFLAIVMFSVLGIRGTKSYWAAGVAAMMISFFLFKDKDRFQQAVVEGIKDDIFILSMLALYFAGILSKILAAGHLVDGLMWLASVVHLSPSILPFATFIISAVIATASGTSAGTVATVGPIMLPLGSSMGCPVEIICGAIISGAYFGDNLAPVSDTTIASAMTQQVSLGKAVKDRMKYSLLSGSFATVMFLITGFRVLSGSGAAEITGDPAYAMNIVYVLLPVMVVVLMISGKNLLTSLLLTNLVGLIMLSVMGLGTYREFFSADGLIVSGIEGMQGATILMMFAFIINSLTRAAGFMDRMVLAVQSRAKTPKAAEIAVGLFITVLMAATGGNTASIAVTGPLARRLMRPFRVARVRTANLLAGISSGIGGFVPYSPANAALASLAVTLGAAKSADFSSFNYAGYVFNCMALIVIYWSAILIGWGLKIETREELLADGVDPDEEL